MQKSIVLHYMKLCSFIPVLIVFFSCQGQTEVRKVGGPCEGCEALLEYENEVLNSVDTLPGFEANEPKLHLSGVVYQADGKTPANGVIIYIYHTNTKGIYETKGDVTGWARRHGIYRGWVKTDEGGRYDFYTFRPASYPDTTVPQHIHVTVKEKDTVPYFVDSFFFEDDPFLPDQVRNGNQKRGGSGIVSPIPTSGIQEIKRDIILGLNIPDY